jgi:HK97 family phage major capsid protein
MVEKYKEAFKEYILTGSTTGMEAGRNPRTGGYYLPTEMENKLSAALLKSSPMRSISNVIRMEVQDFGKGLKDSIPFTTQAELNSLPSLEDWLLHSLSSSISYRENKDFITGPSGFLSRQKVPVDNYTGFEIGYIPTGASGDFASANVINQLRDLQFKLKAEYRQNAKFLMSNFTLSRIHKLINKNSAFFYSDDRGKNLLLGPEVAVVDGMPDIEPDSHSIAYGDFKSAFRIVDEGATSILRRSSNFISPISFEVSRTTYHNVVEVGAIKTLKFGRL